MRILHVSASYLPARRYGGTIVSVHGLCGALAARGHDVHVFTTSVDGDRDSDVPHGQPVDLDGVKVWYFKSSAARRLYWAPSMREALARQIHSFDLVHTHAIYLWPMWAAETAASRAGVPYVISPRGMLEKELIHRKSAIVKGVLIGFIEKRKLERAAAIHVTSRREAEEAAAFGFDLPPFIEIPNGVTLDVDPRGGLSPRVQAIVDEGPFLLFLGRVSWKKGVDRLIAALPHAPHVKLVVAGVDDEDLVPRLERQAAAIGVADRVRFIGAVEGADKAALLSRATALALTSYSENFGNVVVEAMAAGLPVIVTPEVGLAPFVAASGAGMVVEGGPLDLGGAVVRLMSDASVRLDMGRRGRDAAARHFTWSGVAAQMEAAYQSILQAKVH